MPRENPPLLGAPSDWMSLGPASRLVGVDPDTMRRWADGGRIRAFSTPGGHRRFSRADLDQLVASRRGATQPLASVGTTPDRMTRAYARAYRDGAPVAEGLLGADSRAVLRTEGRRLIAVILAYLDATKPNDRERWEGEALTLIGSAATQLAAAGADVKEVLAIYLRARKPLLGELAALGRRRALDPGQLATLYERAVGLLDRLLLHLVETHASAVAASHRGPEPWT
ncbi:MAG: helix-turn-helix domain-containing protein [Candidatus Limnocylindrales bacterium]